MKRQDDLLRALYTVYGDAAALLDPRTAHLVVEGRDVLSRQTIPGVELQAEPQDDALVAEIRVADGVRVASPIHTCVGILGAHGAQRIRLRLVLGRQSSASLLAHCLFPNAEAARHVMEAEIEVGEGAELRYSEGHYHGASGGMEVYPRARVRVGPGARYFADFSLLTGRVGRLVLDYTIEVAAHAVVEVNARVFGHGADEICLRDEIILAGEEARGLVRTRVAVEDEARAEVIGVTRGQAAGARGHMDCLELVRDRARARAEPIVDVSHPLAKVTHEAAVGTVDQKQLETLMAHGLAPDEAVNMIITGVLR